MCARSVNAILKRTRGQISPITLSVLAVSVRTGKSSIWSEKGARHECLSRHKIPRIGPHRDETGSGLPHSARWSRPAVEMMSNSLRRGASECLSCRVLRKGNDPELPALVEQRFPGSGSNQTKFYASEYPKGYWDPAVYGRFIQHTGRSQW